TTVTLRGTGSLRLNNASPYGGGTFVGDTATLNFANGAVLGNNGNLTMSNGTTLFLRQAGGAANCGNNIIIPDGQAANFTSDALGNGVTANVNGGPLSTNVFITGPGLTYANLTTKQLQNFLGTVEVQSASTLRFFNNVGTVNGGDSTTFQVDS